MSDHLFEHPEVIERLAERKRLSFFLDYDGTLTSIEDTPSAAGPSFELKRLLAEVSAKFPAVIVSGRALAGLYPMLGMDDIVYAGNHGMEIRGRDFTMVYDIGPKIKSSIEEVYKELLPLEKRYEGVSIENKKLTLTCHYRLLATSRRELFRDFFKTIRKGAEEGFIRIARSKEALEVRPAVNWDKGRCVEWLLERPAFQGTYPVYAGDDRTDNDAFRTLRDKGLTIFVGKGSSLARFHLRDYRELRAFLVRLAKE